MVEEAARAHEIWTKVALPTAVGVQGSSDVVASPAPRHVRAIPNPERRGAQLTQQDATCDKAPTRSGGLRGCKT
eukprot:7545374-Alexandrium_andersonii.AAC.1